VPSQSDRVACTQTVKLTAGHHVGHTIGYPQAANWAVAYGRKQTQARTPQQKARLFPAATFRYRFGKQVDHAVVCRIEGSCDIAAAEDGRFQLRRNCFNNRKIKNRGFCSGAACRAERDVKATRSHCGDHQIVKVGA
jgi:hypothetical protein